MFEEIGTSIMERAGPLRPAKAARIQGLAKKRANAEIAAATKILKRAYREEGIRLTDADARKRVLADQHVFLGKVEPKLLQGETAKPKTRKAKTTTKAKTAKKVSPAKVEPVKFPPRYAATITAQFGAAFLKRLWEVSHATGIDPKLLVRIKSSTGRPRDPRRVAISYRAWNTRREKYNLPEKERVAVPPDEQRKRSKRGKKAARTKIRKLVANGIDPAKARKELTKHATRTQRRMRREQDIAA